MRTEGTFFRRKQRKEYHSRSSLRVSEFEKMRTERPVAHMGEQEIRQKLFICLDETTQETRKLIREVRQSAIQYYTPIIQRKH